MKSFDDLNESEILALDDAQVNQYIDLACAEAGVPLLPPRPSEPTAVPAVADVTVYGVGGEFYFYDQADALKAVEVLASLRRCSLHYVSGPRYERVVKPTNSDMTVSAEKHFTPETWDRVKNDANRYAEQKKAYDADLAEYNNASTERDRIAQWIYDKRERVCADERRRKMLRASFDRYLSLADGNREIAVRFLKNAYGDADTMLPELFGPVEV